VLSPDGVHLFYVADEDGDNESELRRTRLDGSASSLVLHESAGSFGGLGTTPDSSVVVFRLAVTTSFRLYRVPSDGNAPAALLTGTMIAAGDVSAPNTAPFQISADGIWVVYRADALLNERNELFSVRVDGSAAPLRLIPHLVAGGDVALAENGDFRISPDSSRVVYRADQEIDEHYELYSVPIDGSAAAVKLNGTLGVNQDVDSLGRPSFRISADGEHVLYCADQDADQRLDLYSAPIDGSTAAVNLSLLSPVQDLDPWRYECSPDSLRAVYQIFDGPGLAAPIRLFSSPIDGSTARTRLDPAGAAFGNVYEFQLASDGSFVVYRGTTDSQSREDLFLVPTDGSQLAQRVNRSMPVGAAGLHLPTNTLFALHPDLSRVLYVADQAIPTVAGLWVRYLHRPRRY
jgi:Tol biopolymer transport system component